MSASSVAFYCADCHKTKPVKRNGGSGYATLYDSIGPKTICYECADKRERDFVSLHNVWVGYLSVAGDSVTTWSGGKVMTVTQQTDPDGGIGSPVLSRRLTYIKATDDQGNRWYGKCAGRGMVIKMRRVKADLIEPAKPEVPANN